MIFTSPNRNYYDCFIIYALLGARARWFRTTLSAATAAISCGTILLYKSNLFSLIFSARYYYYFNTVIVAMCNNRSRQVLWTARCSSFITEHARGVMGVGRGARRWRNSYGCYDQRVHACTVRVRITNTCTRRPVDRASCIGIAVKLVRFAHALRRNVNSPRRVESHHHGRTERSHVKFKSYNTSHGPGCAFSCVRACVSYVSSS